MDKSVMVIEPISRSKLIDFTELWNYRSLFWQFAKRDVSLRYKQAVMGIAWAVLQPLLPAIIFAIVFGIFMKAPSDGQPYLIFVFAGMVIWNFFSQVLLRAGNSLTANASLITKVYFPRIVIPLASTGAVLFDLLISGVLLFALMLFYSVIPTWRLIFLPMVIFLAYIASAGISFWFSALNVKYRDFMYALPFIVQVWLYATPVVYSSSVVPQQWQMLFSLNPAVGLVEGARWAVLGGSALTPLAFAVSVATSIFFFVSGTLVLPENGTIICGCNMTKPAIDIQHIGKRYEVSKQQGSSSYRTLQESLLSIPRNLLKRKKTGEDFWALQDISFSVNPGERIGIIGRNGAGKSTLLKILSRITAPTQGRIELRGRVASLLEVGTGFHPELTGRENIFMNGSLMGMSKREILSKFDEIVDFAEVEQFIDTPVKRYSSGMYVRLAFAVAAHLEPEILLVDEVLAVGDAQFQKKCLGKMEDVAHQSGRTILFVSHSMAAIENLCNRCIFLSKGQLVAQGETSMVLSQYAQTSQTSQLIGDRADRGGDGKVRLTAFLMRATDGQVVSSVQSGKKIAFEFEINNTGKTELTGVLVAFGMNNLAGVRIAHFSSELCGMPIDTIPPGISRIVLTLPSIPLVAGRYTITTFVSVKGVIADWVQDAVAIDIDGGDFFGSGRTYSASEGQFFIPHAIEILG